MEKSKQDRKVNLLALQCIELLTQQLQKLNNQQSRSTFAKGGSVGSLMDNGRVDQPMKPLSMQPMQVMQQMRTKLAEGGWSMTNLRFCI